MSARTRIRIPLWERALRLPVAGDGDFVDGRTPPSDADPQHLRAIDDSALRSRLILAGLAQGVQSPKGRQRFKSIVRLYPDGDAPREERKRLRATVTAIAVLPTVEQLTVLLSRVADVEHEVGSVMRKNLEGRFRQLKKQIGTLEGDDFERAFRELGIAVKERHELAKRVREEAFRRIEADGAFEPRRLLRFVARDVG